MLKRIPFVFSSSSTRHNDLDASSQQQARMSASCATRELDELMASLSDFKVEGIMGKGCKGYFTSSVLKLLLKTFFSLFSSSYLARPSPVL